MPFLIPSVAAKIHPAVSYAYLLFEMASALLSHYQTVFLLTRSVTVKAWAKISGSLLALNVMSMSVLLGVFANDSFRHAASAAAERFGGGVVWSVASLGFEGEVSVFLFMLTVTGFQALALGRYAFKLHVNGRFFIYASLVSVIAIAVSWVLSTGLVVGPAAPIAVMFFASILLIFIMLRLRSPAETALGKAVGVDG